MFKNFNPHFSFEFREKWGLGSLPDFIIIGTQKGGTTSLYYYLGCHCRVKHAVRKEVGYFDSHFDRPLGWYKAHFPVLNRIRGLRVGEATPTYLFEPDAPARIAGILPGIKIIVLLRNPVDRAVSGYCMNRSRWGLEATFEEMVRYEIALLKRQKNPDAPLPGWHIVAWGCYAQQLKRWFRFFDRDQFCILKSEDFFRKPQDSVDQVFRFLNVRPVPVDVSCVHNQGQERFFIGPQVYEMLKRFYEPYNQELYKLLGVDYRWGI